MKVNRTLDLYLKGANVCITSQKETTELIKPEAKEEVNKATAKQIKVSNKVTPNQIKDVNKAKAKKKKKFEKLLIKINENGKLETAGSKAVAIFMTQQDENLIDYDLTNNLWAFHPILYNKFKLYLRNKLLAFEGPLESVIELLKFEVPENEIELQNKIYDHFYYFQKEAVIKTINFGGRVLLGDDMGLGKTTTSLGIAYFYKEEWPLLIIAPSSLLENWQNEIKMVLKKDSVIIRGKEDFGEEISIISYAMATKYYELIKLYDFNVVIADECHMLKNTKAERTCKLINSLIKANRVVLISGTPALNRPAELFSLIKILNQKVFPNFFHYGMKYCAGFKSFNNHYDFKGSSNNDELSFILRKYFLIRRTKQEVLKDLPRKVRNLKYITVEEAEEDNCDNIVNNLSNNQIDPTIIGKYKEIGNRKLEQVIKLIEDKIEDKIKTLVFAHHQDVISGIVEHFKAKEVGLIKIDGKVLPAKRQKLCDSFQMNADILIGVLGLTSASVGLNLTAAKRVIFAELHWTPAILFQAEDRVHRIGQKDNVNIYYVVAKNTFDEALWTSLNKKVNILDKLGVNANRLKEKAKNLKKLIKNK